MRTLHLDYQRVRVTLPWLGWLLLVGGLAMPGFLAANYLNLETANAGWEARVNQLKHASSKPIRALRKRDNAEVRGQVLEVRNANLVLRQLGLPWGQLFAAVEGSTSDNVALLALEPDTRKGTIKISGEAKHLGAVIEFARRLGKQAIFSRVLLQNHQLQKQDPQRPVRFAMVVEWAGARP